MSALEHIVTTYPGWTLIFTFLFMMECVRLATKAWVAAMNAIARHADAANEVDK